MHAAQKEDGRWVRNDRLIGVAAASRRYRRCRALEDIDAKALDELERFFEIYNAEDGKAFRTEQRAGVQDAVAAIRKDARQDMRPPAGPGRALGRLARASG
jgi:inorganic pyrophosphatase